MLVVSALHTFLWIFTWVVSALIQIGSVNSPHLIIIHVYNERRHSEIVNMTMCVYNNIMIMHTTAAYNTYAMPHLVKEVCEHERQTQNCVLYAQTTRF